MQSKTLFVTVGTQLPFERIFSYLIDWIRRTNLTTKVYAQIGETSVEYPFVRKKKYLDSSEFHKWLEAADLVIAHAGMGSIIEASTIGKPVIIVPREAAHGEHRNDHQLDTARRFSDARNIRIATNQLEFDQWMAELLSGDPVKFMDPAKSKHLGLGEAIDGWIRAQYPEV